MVTREDVDKLQTKWERLHAEVDALQEKEAEAYREWMAAARQLDDRNPSLKTNSPT